MKTDHTTSKPYVPLTRIARMMEGRCVMETHVVRDSRTESTHFWGLQDGHTLVLRQQGRRFIDCQERSDPIGIAVNLLKH